MDKRIDVKIHYGTHSYDCLYSQDESMFCPNCGNKTVYYENGEGDYYVGENHVCISCGNAFTIQGPTGGSDSDRQVVEQIKEALSGTSN